VGKGTTGGVAFRYHGRRWRGNAKTLRALVRTSAHKQEGALDAERIFH
jgi:hypothetical protein